MRKLLFVSVLLLAGCSGSPLSLLTGGGPNVAANGNAGRNAAQTVGQTNIQEDRKVFRPEIVTRDDAFVQLQTTQNTETKKVQVEEVGNLVVNEVPLWAVLLIVLGWLFPSPGELFRLIKGEKK